MSETTTTGAKGDTVKTAEKPTSEMEPGEWFTAMDGNYNQVTDARYPAEGEPTDWLPDVDGQEIRKGDYVLVLKGGNYEGKVVRVESVERTHLYKDRSGGYLPKNKLVNTTAWSPATGLNSIGIVFNFSHTHTSPHLTRKVNLTEVDTKRLMLSELLLKRAHADEMAAKVQGEIVTLSIQERRLSAEIEALEVMGGA